MRITSAYIEGFGHFQERDLGALPPGLVLLHGPNEAGKSTILEFVKYVLFGSERGKKPQRLLGARVGGRLSLVDAGRPFTIERLEGSPVVLREAGLTLEGDAVIHSRLGGVDRALFRAICGFSLADLEGLQGLGDEALRDRLFSGALLGAGRSVALARKGLAERRNRLWRPRSSSEIRDLASAYNAARANLAKARESALGLSGLRAAVESAAEEVSACRRVAESERRSVARFFALERAWPHHAAWVEARDQLGSVPVVHMDAGAREQMQALRVDEAQAAAACAGERRRVEAAEAALRQLACEPVILAATEAIATLLVLRDASRASDVGPIRIELDAAHGRLAVAGVDPSFCVSAAGLVTLRELARAVQTGMAAQQVREVAHARLAGEQTALGRALSLRDGLSRDEVAERWLGEVSALARAEGGARMAAEKAALLAQRLSEIPPEPPVEGPIDLGLAGRAQLRGMGLAWQRAAAQAEAAVVAAERARATAAAGLPSDPPPPFSAAALASLDAGLDEAIAAQLVSEHAAAQAERARDRASQARAELGEAWSDARIEQLASDVSAIGRLREASRVACAAEAVVGPSRSAALIVVVAMLGCAVSFAALASVALVFGGVVSGAALVGVAVSFAALAAAVGGVAVARFMRPALHSATETAWASACAVAGLDGSVPPARLDGWLASLREASERLQEARVARRASHEAAFRWESWCRAAAELAASAGVSAPETPVQARSWVGALHERQRQIGVAAVARAAVQRAEAELASARALEAEAERAAREGERLARRLGVPVEIPWIEAFDWLAGVESAQARGLRRAELERDRAAAEGEHAAWQDRWMAVAEALGLSPGEPLAVAETRGQRAEAVAAAWRRADDEVVNAGRRRDEAERALLGLEPAAAAARIAAQEWGAALAREGLPPGLQVAGFEAFIEALGRARAAFDDVQRLGSAQVAAEARVSACLDAAENAAKATGRPTPNDLPGAFALATELGLALQTAEEGERRRGAAVEVANAARRVLAESQAELSRSQEALDGLLAAYGVASAAEFERSFEAVARREALEARADAASVARREALGGLADDPETLVALASGDRDGWRASRQAAEEALSGAEQRRDLAVRIHSQAEAQLAALEVSSAVADGEATASVLAARLESARWAFADVVLADALLERTLLRFREAHQPAVLRAAATYLNAATNGRYHAIEATEDGRDVVVVDSAGGRRLSAELSRGTVELLYIVLRLGLAADRAQHAAALPLVLDDILVNLDPERAEGLARLLAEVSKRHQVLLLTCRPETRDLLLAHTPEAAVVELPRYGGRVTPVPSRVPPVPPRRERPKGEVAQGTQEVLFQLPES